MKTLLLMRHAKSLWNKQVEDDRDRPLGKRGKKNAENMGELLKDEHLTPDLILASSAVRARQTTELLMQELKYHGDICYLNRFYLGEIDAYVQQIQKAEDEVDILLVVGHSPNLDGLFQMATGKVECLPTAAIARLAVPINSWKEFSTEVQCDLVHFWRPRDLSD